jgi:hypothetical protein
MDPAGQYTKEEIERARQELKDIMVDPRFNELVLLCLELIDMGKGPIEVLGDYLKEYMKRHKPPQSKKAGRIKLMPWRRIRGITSVLQCLVILAQHKRPYSAQVARSFIKAIDIPLGIKP